MKTSWLVCFVRSRFHDVSLATGMENIQHRGDYNVVFSPELMLCSSAGESMWNLNDSDKRPREWTHASQHTC